MINKTIHYVLLFVLIGVPFIFINYSGYSKGSSPTSFQTVCSILFLVGWFALGYAAGRFKQRPFWIATLIYWGLGLVGLLCGYYLEIDFLYLLYLLAAICYLGPAYGVFSLMPLNTQLLMMAVPPVVTGMLGLTGYSLALLLHKRSDD